MRSFLLLLCLTVTACSSEQSEVVVDDANSNQAPIAQNDAVSVQVGETVDFNILSNDSDVDNDELFLEAVTTEQNSPIGSVVNWEEDGSVSFQAGDQAGVYSFTYKVSSGASQDIYGSDMGEVEITVGN